MEEMINNLVSEIHNFYDEAAKLPKPKEYKVGGTYYGSTELFKSVGNHLDLLEDIKYSVSEYGGFVKHYENVYAVRIGGAYNLSTAPLSDKLSAIIKNNEHNLELISEYGSNFSVIGFGRRIRK